MYLHLPAQPTWFGIVTRLMTTYHINFPSVGGVIMGVVMAIFVIFDNL